jgi:RNA polymerase sigma-70 factor (ECF subfamily)
MMSGSSIETGGGVDEDAPAPGPGDAPVPKQVLSFETVYGQYFDFVWSSARRLGIQPAEIEDLIQEVFMVIHAKLHTIEKQESLRSWIYGVVRRIASSHRRAARGYTNSSADASGDGEALSREPTPLEQTERNAGLQLLMALLDELDEPKREIFSLVDVEDLSVPEAAEVLGIPLNTAYSRLRGARQSFEEVLARNAARTKQT